MVKGNTKELKWEKVLRVGTYVNSADISSDGNKVIGGNFYHKYGGNSDEMKEIFGVFCFDSLGNELWKDEFEAWQGVYWVAISGNACYAASGGWLSDNPYNGFIKAYNANTGKILLDVKTAGRVNKVSLSRDGKYLCAGSDLLYYFELDSNKTYKLVDKVTSGTHASEIISSDISGDGKYVVCSNNNGYINLYEFDVGAKLNLKANWELPSGKYSNCTQITKNGNWFSCSGHDGYIFVFNTSNFIVTNKPEYKHRIKTGGTVYGVFVSEDGKFVSGLSNGSREAGIKGCVSLLSVEKDNLKVDWQYQTLRAPNSTTMDLNAHYVTVADGHPDGCPGHFYLFDRASGKLLWKFTTDNMNWPMKIASDASGIVAGSDNSKIYYFNLK